MTSGSRSTRSTKCCPGFRSSLRARRETSRCLAAVGRVRRARCGGWRVREAARSAPVPNPLANAQFTRFTDWEGTEEGAEISPDGKFVAFLADRAGEFDIWLSQVGTGASESDRQDSSARTQWIHRTKTRLFGDGADIWFNPGDSKPLLLMPLTGGTPRPFLGEGANAPAWSPDGTHVAFVYKPNRDDPMSVADRNFGDRRQILPPGTNKVNNPVWSLRRPVDLLRPRTGAAGRDRNGRVARSDPRADRRSD